jgi:pyruvate/2-oxoglutarate dehydrogenase complex dihydrolipoamide acyltransferase (E2) component
VAARRRAEELNVNLAEVEGTGQDGQITVEDVRRSAQEG